MTQPYRVVLRTLELGGVIWKSVEMEAIEFKDALSRAEMGHGSVCLEGHNSSRKTNSAHGISDKTPGN